MTAYACLPRPCIAHQNYALRTIAPADIELIRQWRNAQMDVLRQQREISPAEQVVYYERQIWPTLPDPQPHNLLMAYLHDDRLIGYGGLVHIAWEHRRAEISFLLNDARIHDQVGYGRDFTAFLQLICDMAFNDLQLHRIFTETYSNRDYHIRVLEAVGFRMEGTMYDHVCINGVYLNSHIHGKLNMYEK